MDTVHADQEISSSWNDQFVCIDGDNKSEYRKILIKTRPCTLMIGKGLDILG